ncbi:MAG: 50S ribosomal protein L23 [Rhodobacteraceae bacterium]|nr:50S ribosomal protein L23 [Paracoccaceae bacterium]
MTATARHYDLLRRPIQTEKSTHASANNTIVFETAMDADKKEIRQAVEAIFKVKVRSVNTLVRKGKRVRFRGIPGRRPSTKRAYVRLEAGYTIDTGGRA